MTWMCNYQRNCLPTAYILLRKQLLYNTFLILTHNNHNILEWIEWTNRKLYLNLAVPLFTLPLNNTSSNSVGSQSFDHSPSLRWHKELRPNITATLHEQTNEDSAHLVPIFSRNTTQNWFKIDPRLQIPCKPCSKLAWELQIDIKFHIGASFTLILFTYCITLQ